MSILQLALILAALILAAVTLVESRGRGLLPWAVVCIAVALLLPVLKSL